MEFSFRTLPVNALRWSVSVSVYLPALQFRDYSMENSSLKVALSGDLLIMAGGHKDVPQLSTFNIAMERSDCRGNGKDLFPTIHLQLPSMG